MSPLEPRERAAITMRAQSYDPQRGCPRCNGVSHDQWMPMLDEYYAFLPERVTRSCKCGFQWWELVKQWW